jgi:hypothetical protein
MARTPLAHRPVSGGSFGKRQVREVGCAFAQGFFFSPPLDAIKTGSLLQGGALEVA